MELLQFLYIVPLNLAYKVTGKIPVKVRYGIIGGSFFVMIAFFLFCYSFPHTKVRFDYEQEGWLNMIPLGLIILMSVDRPLKVLRWNPMLGIPWAIYGIVSFIVSLFFDIGPGFLPFSVCVLFLFPCLYLVWNNRQDYDTLFALASKAMVVNLLIFFVISILFYPMSEETVTYGRYMSSTANPNTLGTIAASSITCCLYLIFQNKRPVPLYMVTCAIASSMLILSESRTSFISAFLQLGLFLIFYIFRYMKEHDWLKTMIRLCLLLLLVITFFPINTALLSEKSDSVADVTQVSKQEEQESENTTKADRKKEMAKANKKQGDNKDKKEKRSTRTEQKAERNKVGQKENLTARNQEKGKNKAGQNEKREKQKNKTEQQEQEEQQASTSPIQEQTILDRFQTSGMDWNQLSSGRLGIWIAYLQATSWKGHLEEEIIVGDEDYRMWAHNVIIELAYRFGIGVALLYLFIMIYSGVYVLKSTFSKKFYEKNRYCFFPAIAITSFCVISMLEMVMFPLERDFVLLWFIGITPLFQGIEPHKGQRKKHRKRLYRILKYKWRKRRRETAV
ncbi:hypothetical protein D3Z38_08380 [Clostridiales bacterium]|nr:hypothetical protein [Clostridiales bacterium]